MRQFFKGARRDGWDFYTGKTINYRESIGKVVHVPNGISKDYSLCSNTVLHASAEPTGVFVGSKIPLSLYLVEGDYVVDSKEDSQVRKFGFTEFKVIEEIPEEKFDSLFGFKYQEVLHPLDPRKITITQEVSTNEIKILKTWDSVRDSVRGSVRGSVWDSVRGSVRDSVRDSVRGSVWGSVWDSEAAYISSLFTSIKKWKYTEKIEIEGYPFQSCVELVKIGLVPCTDGKLWYLVHPKEGAVGEIKWKGKLD